MYWVSEYRLLTRGYSFYITLMALFSRSFPSKNKTYQEGSVFF